jgi:hypothetical protein
MEEQPFIHDLCECQRSFETKGRPHTLFDECSFYDAVSGTPQNRFDECTFEPLSGVEDLIFARRRVKSVLQ